MTVHRIAGDLALDLANTVSWRGTERQFDHLGDHAAVLAWARQGGLLGADESRPNGPSERVRRRLLRLRDAIDAAGAAIAAGQPPPGLALDVIRDMAARALAEARLAGTPARLHFDGDDRIVGPVAWAALDLLRGDELHRLKRCPAEHCGWLFVDRTKNGSRRWCDMTTCGDLAKRRRRQSM